MSHQASQTRRTRGEHYGATSWPSNMQSLSALVKLMQHKVVVSRSSRRKKSSTWNRQKSKQSPENGPEADARCTGLGFIGFRVTCLDMQFNARMVSCDKLVTLNPETRNLVLPTGGQ